MAKNAVGDWSTTAADNTDVGGVGITGNNLPSNLDDAQRTIMAQIAAWYAVVPRTNAANTFTSAITIENNDPGLRLKDASVTNLEHYARSFSDMMTIEADANNVQADSQILFRVDAGTRGGVTGGGYLWSQAGFMFGGGGAANDLLTFNDSTNEFSFTADGAVSSSIVIGGSFKSEAETSTPGTNAFNINVAGAKSMSRSTTAASTQLGFYNPNGLVGQVNTSGSGTTFQTTSDETRKIRTGYLSGADAIAVILADPVWTYNWKPEFGGTSDIGWGAQTSRAIHPSLASAPYWMDEVEGTEVPEGTEGAIYIPAGMDLGRRTPFLWAATANLISRIEELETRLAALEA